MLSTMIVQEAGGVAAGKGSVFISDFHFMVWME